MSNPQKRARKAVRVRNVKLRHHQVTYQEGSALSAFSRGFTGSFRLAANLFKAIGRIGGSHIKGT